MLEQLYIHCFKTRDKRFGYNMTDGGDGSRGRKMSPEHLEKLVSIHKGKTLTNEHKEKISKANRGRKASPETRERLRVSHLGQKPSEKSIAMFKQYLELGLSKKAVYALDKNGTRYDFESISDASNQLNLPILNKKFRDIVIHRRLVGGMRWFYVNEDECIIESEDAKQERIRQGNVKKSKPIYCIDEEGNRLDFLNGREASEYFKSSRLQTGVKKYITTSKVYYSKYYDKNYYWFYANKELESEEIHNE